MPREKQPFIITIEVIEELITRSGIFKKYLMDFKAVLREMALANGNHRFNPRVEGAMKEAYEFTKSLVNSERKNSTYRPPEIFQNLHNFPNIIQQCRTLFKNLGTISHSMGMSGMEADKKRHLSVAFCVLWMALKEEYHALREVEILFLCNSRFSVRWQDGPQKQIKDFKKALLKFSRDEVRLELIQAYKVLKERVLSTCLGYSTILSARDICEPVSCYERWVRLGQTLNYMKLYAGEDKIRKIFDKETSPWINGESKVDVVAVLLFRIRFLGWMNSKSAMLSPKDKSSDLVIFSSKKTSSFDHYTIMQSMLREAGLDVSVCTAIRSEFIHAYIAGEVDIVVEFVYLLGCFNQEKHEAIRKLEAKVENLRKQIAEAQNFISLSEPLKKKARDLLYALATLEKGIKNYKSPRLEVIEKKFQFQSDKKSGYVHILAEDRGAYFQTIELKLDDLLKRCDTIKYRAELESSYQKTGMEIGGKYRELNALLDNLFQVIKKDIPKEFIFSGQDIILEVKRLLQEQGDLLKSEPNDGNLEARLSKLRSSLGSIDEALKAGEKLTGDVARYNSIYGDMCTAVKENCREEDINNRLKQVNKHIEQLGEHSFYVEEGIIKKRSALLERLQACKSALEIQHVQCRKFQESYQQASLSDKCTYTSLCIGQSDLKRYLKSDSVLEAKCRKVFTECEEHIIEYKKILAKYKAQYEKKLGLLKKRIRKTMPVCEKAKRLVKNISAFLKKKKLESTKFTENLNEYMEKINQLKNDILAIKNDSETPSAVTSGYDYPAHLKQLTSQKEKLLALKVELEEQIAIAEKSVQDYKDVEEMLNGKDGVEEMLHKIFSQLTKNEITNGSLLKVEEFNSQVLDQRARAKAGNIDLAAVSQLYSSVETLKNIVTDDIRDRVALLKTEYSASRKKLKTLATLTNEASLVLGEQCEQSNEYQHIVKAGKVVKKKISVGKKCIANGKLKSAKELQKEIEPALVQLEQKVEAFHRKAQRFKLQQGGSSYSLQSGLWGQTREEAEDGSPTEDLSPMDCLKKTATTVAASVLG